MSSGPSLAQYVETPQILDLHEVNMGKTIDALGMDLLIPILKEHFVAS